MTDALAIVVAGGAITLAVTGVGFLQARMTRKWDALARATEAKAEADAETAKDMRAQAAEERAEDRAERRLVAARVAARVAAVAVTLDAATTATAERLAGLERVADATHKLVNKRYTEALQLAATYARSLAVSTGLSEHNVLAETAERLLAEQRVQQAISDLGEERIP